MLSLQDQSSRLCDGLSRREVLRAGGLAALGLSLPALLRARATASPKSTGHAKSCIVLFLMGGPPQHSTWDPKPDAPSEIRGEFGPTDTNVPGIRVSSVLPNLARHADKLCIVRAMSTGDSAHSSSGYQMMTGVPHSPLNAENVNPGPPNDWPTLGAIVRRLRGDQGGLPAAVRLPMHIFNTDSSIWPGQDAGFLGRASDPWLFRCEPASTDFRIPEFTLSAEMPLERLTNRRDLLQEFDRALAACAAGPIGRYDRSTNQAFDLLASPQARAAFDLNREPPAVRDRYGRHHFGQSCLLARRLVEAGVGLVQVNWFRGPNEPPDNPCWDSHTKEAERLKTFLAPTADQAFAGLLADLDERGLLEETLVLCISEFGRTPRMNNRGGRDHWGHVFSIALAGGGIRGGQLYGSSDKQGGYPREGKVIPQDLTATVLHCLGYDPHAEYRDPLGRPLVASRGDIIRAIL
ncbi:MAG TPA: DUF1501 domain-containing protein [Gemmataceae bacterium]|jgi:hypothetical protein|nr:DUF1501 domain-containing protein [Gemmataceae bacterium]